MSRLSLSIKIPNKCYCSDDCICKNYIKCSNNCFCGNKREIKQKKSIYAAFTPDYKNYNRLSYKLREKSISFGSFDIIMVTPIEYFSPIKLSPKIYFSPQLNKNKKINIIRTPNSV
jgi:hypothetical protein